MILLPAGQVADQTQQQTLVGTGGPTREPVAAAAAAFMRPEDQHAELVLI